MQDVLPLIKFFNSEIYLSTCICPFFQASHTMTMEVCYLDDTRLNDVFQTHLQKI